MTATAYRPSPAWPPLDAAMATLARTDWAALADRAAVAVLTLAAWAVVLTRRALPYVAAALRAAAALADRLAADLATRPAATPAAPAAAPAADLAGLTVIELRRRAAAAGLPRRLAVYGRRADLIAALSA